MNGFCQSAVVFEVFWSFFDSVQQIIKTKKTKLKRNELRVETDCKTIQNHQETIHGFGPDAIGSIDQNSTYTGSIQ